MVLDRFIYSTNFEGCGYGNGCIKSPYSTDSYSICANALICKSIVKFLCNCHRLGTEALDKTVHRLLRGVI